MPENNIDNDVIELIARLKSKYEENKEELNLKSKNLQTKYRDSYRLLKKIYKENLQLPEIIHQIKNIIE